jgi:hypothetical protein
VGTARRSLEDLKLHSAGSESIHAVISACDALTVARLGMRCRGEDHRDVLRLVDRIPDTRWADLKRQITDVLAVKNMVGYGGEGLAPERARRVVLQAGRIVRWVSESLGACAPYGNAVRGPQTCLPADLGNR